MHKKKDHALGLGRKVRLLRRKRILRRLGLVGEEPSKGEHSKARGAGLEELTAREGALKSVASVAFHSNILPQLLLKDSFGCSLGTIIPEWQ